MVNTLDLMKCLFVFAVGLILLSIAFIELQINLTPQDRAEIEVDYKECFSYSGTIQRSENATFAQ